MATRDAVEAAKAAGLRYLPDTGPGYRRRRRGKGFSYHTPEGELVRGEARKRIEALAIPPAWTEVWISPSPKGHLQATGRDERGRKQYLYHPRWRQAREREKYQHLCRFARCLPEIRRAVERDLSRPGLERDRVLAAVVRLLDTSHIRIGNDAYARENGAYGLSTIRKKHVDVDGTTVTFEFRGKSGKPWRVEVEDPELAEIVERCYETPGYELFKYVDDAGERRDVKAADVNDYLRRVSGEEISAKDFRTWSGTVLAVSELLEFETFTSERQAKRNVVAAVKRVAEHLGNTPAICRQSYIHPHVLDAYLEGELAEVEVPEKAPPHLDGVEVAVLEFLEVKMAA